MGMLEQHVIDVREERMWQYWTNLLKEQIEIYPSTQFLFANKKIGFTH